MKYYSETPGSVLYGTMALHASIYSFSLLGQDRAARVPCWREIAQAI